MKKKIIETKTLNTKMLITPADLQKEKNNNQKDKKTRYHKERKKWNFYKEVNNPSRDEK